MRGNSNRFYYQGENLGSEILVVDDKDLIRQWQKVMRFGEGDVVRLFDGKGWEYSYELQVTCLDGRQASYEGGGEVKSLKCKVQNCSSKLKSGGMRLQLIEKRMVEDDGVRVVLGFGLLKHKERMEWMLEKCVELGVDEFIPFVAQNSQVKEMKNISRWEKIVVEACEQSGRIKVPSIKWQVASGNGGKIRMTNDKLQDWNDFIDDSYIDYLKICWDGSGEKMDIKRLQESVVKYDKKVLMVVGPEGGWSRDEIDFFRDNDFEILSFAGNVLRAETAGVLGVGLVRQVIG